MMRAIERLKIRRMMGRVMVMADGKLHKVNGFAIINGANGRTIIPVANLVTNDGDIYYAEAGVGAPTMSIAGMRLGTGITAPAKGDTDVAIFLAGSGKVIDGSYPVVVDPDTNNTGDGVNVVSWRVSYNTTEANGSNIAELALVDNIVTPTKALCRALFGATFNKTSSDTLTVFVNHTMLGA